MTLYPFENNNSATGSSLVYVQGDYNTFNGCAFEDTSANADTLIEFNSGANYNSFNGSRFVYGDTRVLNIDGAGNRFVNNFFEVAANAAVWADVDASDVVLANNIIFHSDTPSGDLFNVAGDDCVVVGNVTPVAFSSATIASGNRNVVVANALAANTVTDSGTSSQVANNS